MMERKSSLEVVVTDIRMPFGSMVVFMVKWAIAAIPAIVILVAISLASIALLTALANSVANSSRIAKSDPSPQQPITTYVAPAEPPRGKERCKGNPDEAKCIEFENRLSAESPEAKRQRQAAFEDERKANMELIGK